MLCGENGDLSLDFIYRFWKALRSSLSSRRIQLVECFSYLGLVRKYQAVLHIPRFVCVRFILDTLRIGEE